MCQYSMQLVSNSVPLSHVYCSRIDASSDGVVIEKELINVIVVKIQTNQLDW